MTPRIKANKDRICTVCNKPFTAKGKEHRCSDECKRIHNNNLNSIRSKERYIKTNKSQFTGKICPQCFKEFNPTRSNEVCCSQECTESYKKEYQKQKSKESRLKKKLDGVIDIDYNIILELIERYKTINQIHLKKNIKKYAKENKIPRANLSILLKFDYNQFENFLNLYKDLIMPIEMVMKICLFFNIKIEDLAKEVEIIEKPEKYNKRWTEEVKKEFINDYENFTEMQIAEKYKLNTNSARATYLKFKKEF